MADVPSRAEVAEQYKRIKDNAPGDDEVASTMLKNDGEIGDELIPRTVQMLWCTDPAEWPEVFHKMTGFRLCKKGENNNMWN